jgi:hypothetical protein
MPKLGIEYNLEFFVIIQFEFVLKNAEEDETPNKSFHLPSTVVKRDLLH